MVGVFLVNQHLPIWPGHGILVNFRGLRMHFGFEEATAGFVIPLLLTPNDTASAEGSAGLKHEWDPAVDKGAGTKGAGCCVVGLLDGNDRVSVSCTSIARAASVIMSVFNGRPEYSTNGKRPIIIFL